MLKNSKLLFISFLFVILLTGCTSKPVIEKQAPVLQDDKPLVSEYKLSLVMAGDALIHGAVYTDAKTGDNTYDFKPMFEEIKPVISTYDLAYYNQETIIGGKELGLSTYPRFNSPEELGDAFLDAGFDLVSTANNHSLDRGEVAIINSHNYWSDKAAIISGTNLSKEEQENVPVYEENNIKYAFLSYTYGTNGLYAPTGKEYLVNTYTEELAKKQIDSVKDKVDVIIVAMHWGSEYNFAPNAFQKEAAEYLSELGVNLIIGAHPHVVQPIEKIGDTLVIYSLGNFISGQEGLYKLIGLVSAVDIVKKVEDNQTTIEINNVKAELVYTSRTNSFTNFKVIPFSKLTSDILPDYENIKNEYQDIVKGNSDFISFGIFN